MSEGSRREVMAGLVRKYGHAGRRYRSRLVDEACSVCGYDRKYAIKVLTGNRPGPRGLGRGGGQRLYDAEVAAIVAAIWRAADYPCGKRLEALLPLWLPGYESRRGSVAADVRERVLEASSATLDRLLARERARQPARRGGTKPGRLLRTQIPIRCESWNVDGPGYLEADTVDHGGESTAGDFMRSVTYTDIFSGWIEQAAIWNKSGAAVLRRTREIEADLPFVILGFDSDNGGEFINHALVRFFHGHTPRVEFTRSRAYRKNDNAHVEQKNWTKVRQLLGYARYDRPELVDVVHQLYRGPWRLLQNFFQPAMKLVKKERHGSRVHKKYDRPQTPAQRLLAWPGLRPDVHTWIEKMQRDLDPMELSAAVNRQLQQIRRLLREGRRDAA
jgi:hypothetical protein